MTGYFTEYIMQELHDYINIKEFRYLIYSTPHFKEYRKKFLNWKFNQKYSFKYYSDIEFFNYINEEIIVCGKQLSLIIRNRNDVVDVNHLGDVYSLDLSGCKNITDASALGKVYKLNLSHCSDIIDVSSLGDVHTLNLSSCNGIIDVSSLGKVVNLDLCNTKIRDISSLGNVYNLNLRLCVNILDFSCLGNHHILILGDTNIQNVSNLGNVHKLNLWNCTNITEGISHLGNCHTLILWGMKMNITDELIKYLGNVHTLDLSWCLYITDEGRFPRPASTWSIPSCCSTRWAPSTTRPARPWARPIIPTAASRPSPTFSTGRCATRTRRATAAPSVPATCSG